MDLIASALAHKDALVQIVTAVVTVASLIANLTPTDHDNALVAKLSKLVNMLALNLKK